MRDALPAMYQIIMRISMQPRVRETSAAMANLTYMYAVARLSGSRQALTAGGLGMTGQLLILFIF